MGARKHILVVEDDASFPAALRINLKAWGYSVEFACNGCDAHQVAAQQKFDLVITDYRLGGMTGIELCRLLRSEGYAETPFILASAFQFAKNDEQLKDLKLAAILRKPFSLSILKSTIEHCFACRLAKT